MIREKTNNSGAPFEACLCPCREESVDFDNTENLYIEGDNLDALKLLMQTHRSRVNMIYIDPPYNTGKDFVYKDKWAARGVGGQLNNAWTDMMYPGLVLARDLLSDDGAVFISIDDNEMARLKLACDEIYGERNFVICFNWQTKKAAQGMITENMVVNNHEYILTYAKNKKLFRFIGKQRDESNGFANPDGDPRGLWKRQYLQRLGQGLPERTVVDPATGREYTFETPYTQEKLDAWIQGNYIIFPKDADKYPARKEFLSEYARNQQLVSSLGLYAAKSSTERLYKLFGGVKVFTNPKPDTLLYDLIKWTLKDGGLILDFFSGSATTAHAVMLLNAEEKQKLASAIDSLDKESADYEAGLLALRSGLISTGNRKYIMVQIPEACGRKSEAAKAGYATISEIGKERIRRAGKEINKAFAPSSVIGYAKNEEERGLLPDVGFRVLKIMNGNKP